MLVAALLVAVAGIAAAVHKETPPASPAAAIVKNPPITGNPQIVNVGSYLSKILAVDTLENSYTVDYYLWLTWKGSIDPSDSIDFTNAVGDPAKMVKTYPEPILQSDGLMYQGWHMQATYSQELTFGQFPLDSHELVITIEDNTYDSSALVYQAEPVTASPGFSDIVGGWRLAEAPTGYTTDYTYDSNFGIISDDTGAGAANATYSRMTIATEIARPDGGFVVGGGLPLLITVLVAAVGYFLGPKHIDARLALGVTALLGSVLLRADAVSVLPGVSYLIRIDWIYLTAFTIILVAIGEAVWSMNEDAKGRTARARRVDMIALGASMAAFVVVGLLTLYA